MKFKELLTLWLVFLSLLLSSCSSLPNPFSGKETPELFPIRQNGKVGYINRNGEIVIQPQFADALYFFDGLAVACIEMYKCGYIDSSGKFVINPQFKSAIRFSEGLGGVIVEDKLGFVDKTGKFVINPQFDVVGDFMSGFFSEGLANIKVGDKFGFVGTDGKIVINPQFDNATPFSEGLAAVQLGKKWGFVDKEGKIIINPQFDEARPFCQGLAAVKIGEQFGYIDKTGKIIINPQFNAALPFSDEGIALVFLKDKVGFIDKEGKYLVSPQFLGQDWTWQFYFWMTSNIEKVSFSEGLAPVQVSEKKAGYIDKTGKIVINPQFNVAFPFYGGLAQVYTDSGMGYIDKEGKYVWRETKETVKTQSNTANSTTNTATNNTATNTVTSSTPNTNNTKETEYEGTINNNYEILMTLTRTDKSLSGYVVPKGGGSSIPVSGTIDENNNFNLSEYDDKDNWTGTYKGKISDGTIEGVWTKPDGSAQRSLYLTAK